MHAEVSTHLQGDLCAAGGRTGPWVEIVHGHTPHAGPRKSEEDHICAGQVSHASTWVNMATAWQVQLIQS